MSAEEGLSCGSCQVILTGCFGMRCLSLYHDCWHRSWKKTACLWLLICLKVQKLMRHGSSLMSQKLSSNHHSENPLPCHSWENTPSAWQNQSDCDCFLQLWTVMCSTRLDLTNICIYKCWDVYMMHWIINSCKRWNLSSDKFTMPLHLPTQSSLEANFQLTPFFHKWNSLLAH